MSKILHIVVRMYIKDECTQIISNKESMYYTQYSAAVIDTHVCFLR